MSGLTTIECGRPRERYTLFESGPSLIVHLAGPGRSGGTGRCICGFDRFGSGVGFSVGGGVTGPGVEHEVCSDCARLAGDASIRGIHASLFAAVRYLAIADSIHARHDDCHHMERVMAENAAALAWRLHHPVQYWFVRVQQRLRELRSEYDALRDKLIAAEHVPTQIMDAVEAEAEATMWCTAAANIKGEHIVCDLAPEHGGWAHSNREHELIWDGPLPGYTILPVVAVPVAVDPTTEDA